MVHNIEPQSHCVSSLSSGDCHLDKELIPPPTPVIYPQISDSNLFENLNTFPQVPDHLTVHASKFRSLKACCKTMEQRISKKLKARMYRRNKYHLPSERSNEAGSPTELAALTLPDSSSSWHAHLDSVQGTWGARTATGSWMETRSKEEDSELTSANTTPSRLLRASVMAHTTAAAVENVLSSVEAILAECSDQDAEQSLSWKDELRIAGFGVVDSLGTSKYRGTKSEKLPASVTQMVNNPENSNSVAPAKEDKLDLLVQFRYPNPRTWIAHSGSPTKDASSDQLTQSQNSDDEQSELEYGSTNSTTGRKGMISGERCPNSSDTELFIQFRCPTYLKKWAREDSASDTSLQSSQFIPPVTVSKTPAEHLVDEHINSAYVVGPVVSFQLDQLFILYEAVLHVTAKIRQLQLENQQFALMNNKFSSLTEMILQPRTKIHEPELENYYLQFLHPFEMTQKFHGDLEQMMVWEPGRFADEEQDLSRTPKGIAKLEKLFSETFDNKRTITATTDGAHLAPGLSAVEVGHDKATLDEELAKDLMTEKLTFLQDSWDLLDVKIDEFHDYIEEVDCTVINALDDGGHFDDSNLLNSIRLSKDLKNSATTGELDGPSLAQNLVLTPNSSPLRSRGGVRFTDKIAALSLSKNSSVECVRDTPEGSPARGQIGNLLRRMSSSLTMKSIPDASVEPSQLGGTNQTPRKDQNAQASTAERISLGTHGTIRGSIKKLKLKIAGSVSRGPKSRPALNLDAIESLEEACQIAKKACQSNASQS